MVLRALHLCSGYGGFELALRGIARTVAHVERDAYAAAALVARMEESRLDQAPIWSDLCTFDGSVWRGHVDLITAGFPCQPFSAAGKRLGTDDDRWLWPDIARIICDVEPSYVMLENVPGVVRAGLAHVLSDLAEYGFDAEWGLYAASAIGAPHRRQRFWLVAHRDRDGQPSEWRQPDNDRDARYDANGSSRADVGYAGSSGRSEVTRGTHGNEGPTAGWPTLVGHVADSASEDVAYAPCVDEREPHHQGCALTRHDARTDLGGHRFPPRPDDLDGWEQWDGPQPGVRRGADGVTPWLADALHLGGNGLVPQCAREAWLRLTERLRGA